MSFNLDGFLKSGAIASLSEDKLLIGWGEPVRKAASELNSEFPAFFFNDFFLTFDKSWIQYSNWEEISLDHLERGLIQTSIAPVSDWTILHLEKFKLAFEELHDLLKIGYLEKGVPYLFSHSKSAMTKERLQNCLRSALKALRQRNSFLYGNWDHSSGVLGVTPELLFSHSSNQPSKLHTMALAGTSPLNDCLNDFMKNEKEVCEHQLVVKGICNNLKSLGNVKIGEIEVLRLKTLAHLLTPLEVELQYSFDFNLFVECLHPTPALGAIPQNEGMKWLKEFHQHTPRGLFGAPIGFQFPQLKISRCYVAIRNVQWDDLGLHIGAGCGVVQQSCYEKELNEIQLKLFSIKKQLDL